MANDVPMQADGKGTRPSPPDQNGELASRRGGAEQTGESGGGAYPNPHTGKDGSDKRPGSFMGHGGQTEIAYHGPGQLGDQKVGETENAPTEER
ncbi:MAG TPA: hypothetical protein VF649_12635 [Sphingomonas sp.]|jgi:hypothetical protein|uniref:hypothetical protein n=1 Tax=Sphingomonas sp. TaxID=28214 RepID=UPI002EDA8D19